MPPKSGKRKRVEEEAAPPAAAPALQVVDSTFAAVFTLSKDKEGLVFLGASEPMEWVVGIRELLKKELDIQDAIFEDKHYFLKTSGGRQDVVFMFGPKAGPHIPKLCLWRIRFGDASWLSDYVVNYAHHH